MVQCIHTYICIVQSLCCTSLPSYCVLHYIKLFCNFIYLGVSYCKEESTVVLTRICITMQGPLSSSFPIENRNTPVTLKALKNHLDRAKSLPFVKRISDFHLMLLLARFLDVAADIPALAECVHTESPIPEGYQLLIESMANAS